MYCEKCGTKNDDGGSFCVSCGAGLPKLNDAGQKPATQQPAVPPVVTSPPPAVMPMVTPPAMQQPVLQQPVMQQPVMQQPVMQYQQPMMQQQPKKKKRHGCLTFLLGFLAAIVLLGMAVYVFVPGLLRPYDYGVKSSQTAYESALAKLNYTKDESPTTGTAQSFNNIYGLPGPVDTSLTSEELTSFVSWNRPPYYALSNVQVRINPDDTIDVAARVDVDYVFEHVLDSKYSKEEAIEKVPLLRFIPGKVNLAINIGGKVAQNNFEGLTLNKVSLNGIPLPPSLTASSDAINFVETTLSEFLKKSNVKTGADYELIQVVNGSLAIAGKFPSSLTRVPMN